MPRMTPPLFGPSVTFASKVFGDLGGSSFIVAASTTLSSRLTEYLSPSKLTVIPLNWAAGISLPPASTDWNVQAPWNFLSSFSTSALSSAIARVPPDAVSARVQNSVKKAIRMRVLPLANAAEPQPFKASIPSCERLPKSSPGGDQRTVKRLRKSSPNAELQRWQRGSSEEILYEVTDKWRL